MKFSIKNFFSKFDQIRSFLRIWSHLLKKSLMESFICCVVLLKANSPSFVEKCLPISFFGDHDTAIYQQIQLANKSSLTPQVGKFSRGRSCCYFIKAAHLFCSCFSSMLFILSCFNSHICLFFVKVTKLSNVCCK